MSTVEELLGAGGTIAQRLASYEERPEQMDLARAVEAALANRTSLLAEAGTGIGKSFAYLVPAIVHATSGRARGPIVISTRTIALQQQLELKDLPFLQGVLPLEWSAVTAVGRNNYVCLRRLDLARKERGLLFPDAEREVQLDDIVQWSLSTRDGTRMSLPSPVDHAVWDEVRAEHGNCLNKACPHYDPCHYQRSRRRMGSADILIVNHALYIADVALRMAGANYLPQHEVVIFDEAHHLERVATDGLGLRMTRGTIEWHLRRLHPKNAKRSLLARYGSTISKTLVGQIRMVAEDFFDQFAVRLSRMRQDTCELGDTELETELADVFARLGEELSLDAGNIENVSLKTEMLARARGCLTVAATLHALCLPPRNPDAMPTVRWIERTRRDPELRSAPIDVSEVLRQHLFTPDHTAILTSATMAAGRSGFEWMQRRLGIEDARSLKLGSPFKYREQVELVLEEALPDPGRDPEAFLRESKSRILEHIRANRGRALVLCTSWNFLHEIVEHIREPLLWDGIELLVQDEASVPELLRRKREEPSTVLVGTDTLWEGIDVPGDALTLLIITRFPFATPGHPLTAARLRNIEQQGGSGFMEHSLPEAILRFQQGFGRLVRTSSDRGKVVVLDPRVRTRRYGRMFLDALPEGAQQAEE